MKLSNSYAGHQIDILALDVPDSIEGEVPPSFSNVFRICAGMQKVAQIYIIKLFTALESKLVDKTEGTVIGDLLLGRIAVGADFINDTISIGHVEAVSSILDDQEQRIDSGKTIPDDENLQEATLISIENIDATKVKFTVGLDTLSESGVYIIPVKFPVGS